MSLLGKALVLGRTAKTPEEKARPAVCRVTTCCGGQMRLLEEKETGVLEGLGPSSVAFSERGGEFVDVVFS